MKLDALRINQISPAVFDWYCRYLVVMDKGDLPALLAFFHEDCALQINNHLPMHGHDAIGAAFERYWEAINTIEHELLNIYGNDERFCVEMLWYSRRPRVSPRTRPTVCAHRSRRYGRNQHSRARGSLGKLVRAGPPRSSPARDDRSRTRSCGHARACITSADGPAPTAAPAGAASAARPSCLL